MGKVFFKFLLSFLVALAVGTMSGDALLHLIPHVSPAHGGVGVLLSTLTSVVQSQGSHRHASEDPALSSWEGHHAHDDHHHDLDPVWKGLTALAGVYFMFLIEHCLTLGKMYKDKKQKVVTVTIVVTTVITVATLSIRCSYCYYLYYIVVTFIIKLFLLLCCYYCYYPCCHMLLLLLIRGLLVLLALLLLLPC